MIFALLLNQTFKLRGLVRAIAFLPWAISGVLASVMWSLMYNEHMGVFNDLLMKVGLIDEPKAFLASTSSAFIAVVIDRKSVVYGYRVVFCVNSTILNY